MKEESKDEGQRNRGKEGVREGERDDWKPDGEAAPSHTANTAAAAAAAPFDQVTRSRLSRIERGTAMKMNITQNEKERERERAFHADAAAALPVPSIRVSRSADASLSLVHPLLFDHPTSLSLILVPLFLLFSHSLRFSVRGSRMQSHTRTHMHLHRQSDAE